MIKRLYVHNYKSLQGFTLELENLSSVFLLGRNGSGKSTVLEIVEIFQKIGRGSTSLQELISINSFSFGNHRLPIHLELEAELNGTSFVYTIVVEYPENFHTPRIKEERLRVDSSEILYRDRGQTLINNSTSFSLDWHHIGLPLVSEKSLNDPIAIFRKWLKSIVVLAPFPKFFSSLSKSESSTLDKDGSNVVDFARWLLMNPSLYTKMQDFLVTKMSDLALFKFEDLGNDYKNLVFIFEQDGKDIKLSFDQLSDGEKIFFLAATIVAAQINNPNLLCLWDEPENFVGLVEIKELIMDFRRSFESGRSKSQIILSSHNERVINSFSSHNIYVLSRQSHLLPTRAVLLKHKEYESGTLVDAFINGELDD